MIIQAQPLTDLIGRIVTAAGAEPDRAETCAEHLVAANLKGHDSHGVGMAPSYVRAIKSGKLHPNARAKVVSDQGAVIVVDGQFGLGAPVAREAVALGIARSRQMGVACVALRNSCHIGRIGTYGEQCADAGLVSIHYVNVVGHPPQVAPYGGREARMVTNPYCCTVPRPNGDHLVLDFATSFVAIGKLRVAFMEGKEVPEGALVDAEGRATTDPRTFFRAEDRSLLLPFGLHKGGGMQILCEILGGALAGHWTMQPGSDRAYGAAVNNMLSIIIDPDALGGREAYEAEAEAMLDYIRATPAAEGFDRVRLPGDPEREMMAKRLAEGIPIDDNTWREIREAAASVGINDEVFSTLAQ
ncbi:MAG TPA: malate/lactate/ureidoglycolate dehydrogenase [Caulobacteraceae bacterium]|nr:malate/lactate/ureidoglycolate dehydrogenase [Caulobacteraceae bacterium]